MSFNVLIQRLGKILGFEYRKTIKNQGTINKALISVKIEKKYEFNGPVIVLNPTLFSKEETARFMKEVAAPYIHDFKMPLLEEKAGETTAVLHENLPQKKEVELLEFYKDKLSPEYLQALETALVINKAAKKGDIKLLKDALEKRYPTFGRNMSNMVSSGYFHKDFKELYKYMQEKGASPKEYRREVETIVENQPYTVYVNHFVSQARKLGEVEKKLESAIKEKLVIFKKYGTRKLIIHGLGEWNVKTALVILERVREHPNVDYHEIERDKNKYIRITLYLTE